MMNVSRKLQQYSLMNKMIELEIIIKDAICRFLTVFYDGGSFYVLFQLWKTSGGESKFL